MFPDNKTQDDINNRRYFGIINIIKNKTDIIDATIAACTNLQLVINLPNTQIYVCSLVISIL
jgi:hypothetical protein